MTHFRLKNFLIEPYRIFFAAGSLYALLAIGLWFCWYWGLEHQHPLFHWFKNPPQIHAHVMIFGVIGFYIFGFLLTAYPKWVGVSSPSPTYLLLLFLALLLSQIFLWMGALLLPRAILPAGIAEILAYAGLLFYLGQAYFSSSNWRENKQPFFVFLAFAFGTLGVTCAFFYSLFPALLFFYRISLLLGTYLYLLLIVVAVTFRIVPFFTGRVVPHYEVKRGKPTLPLVLLLLLLKVAVESAFVPLPAKDISSYGIDLLLAMVLTREWLSWKPFATLRVPILFVLYVSLTWILIFLGFSVYGLGSVLFSSKIPFQTSSYPPALHALFIGSLGTLILGISTRVSRGHGGRPILADRWALMAFGLVQIAALWRVATPLLEGSVPISTGKSYLAALFWCGAFLIWMIRYLPFLGQPHQETLPLIPPS